MNHVAVDLGATSGRVVVGGIQNGCLLVHDVARFPTRAVRLPDGLHWDAVRLYDDLVQGVRSACGAFSDVASLGIDSWAIDYGLLRGGQLLGQPFHYRDERSLSIVDAVHAIISRDELHRRHGLQFLSFTTLYQVYAGRELASLADHLLLIPDLMSYWLTGCVHAERTNASTTGLAELGAMRWNDALCEALGVKRTILPAIIEPGTVVGSTLSYVSELFGHEVTVVAVASHDTASAVAAVPMEDPSDAAYISCGTWGLVGVETEAAIVSAAGREANFTNEVGVDGRNRFLTNVTGLWLLSETVAAWESDGERVDLTALLDAAGQLSAPIPTFDPNDARFMQPGDMTGRVRDACIERGLAPPRTRPELVRCIVESLAEAFAGAIETAGELSNRQIRVVHIVGGGVRNQLLCQLVADRTGRRVVAGPVEATVIGNLLVQARSFEGTEPTLEAMRRVVTSSVDVVTYLPRAAARHQRGSDSNGPGSSE